MAIRQLIISTAVFLFVLGGVNWYSKSRSSVQPVEAMGVIETGDTPVNTQVTPPSTPENIVVVHDYMIVVCYDGHNPSIDKTDPVLVVTCGD